MADTIIYVCHNCGKTFDTWKKCCKRQTTMHYRQEWTKRNKRDIMTISHDPFLPYVEENFGPEPVLIESREHRKRLLKATGMEIIPASNRRASTKPIYVFMGGH